MWSRDKKSSNSDDDLGFEDEFDDDEDITESAGVSSSAPSSDKKSTSSKQMKAMASGSSMFSKPSTAATAKREINIDLVISKLLTEKCRNIGMQDELDEDQIGQLIDKARDIFTDQPVFLELSGPVKIVSDIHG